jgi:hypothetical protein
VSPRAGMEAVEKRRFFDPTGTRTPNPPILTELTRLLLVLYTHWLFMHAVLAIDTSVYCQRTRYVAYPLAATEEAAI